MENYFLQLFAKEPQNEEMGFIILETKLMGIVLTKTILTSGKTECSVRIGEGKNFWRTAFFGIWRRKSFTTMIM